MIRKIGVIGAGMTGQGICWSAAQNGIDAVFLDVSEETVQNALKSLNSSLGAEIERWAMTNTEKTVILSRIRGTTKYEDLRNVEMVIEAVPEVQEIKRAVLRDIQNNLPENLVIASNTSVISITELASTLKNPERMVGMHFLYPVPKRPLVEIVRGLRTSDEAVRKTRELGEAMGKTCIEVFESPGYVTTRLIIPLLNEAMTLVMDGIATPEDVDASMRLGYEFNMGPLEMADRMGLDEVMFWMDELFREYGDARYRPNSLLRKKVRAGELGLKTREGFFRYDQSGRRIDAEK